MAKTKEAKRPRGRPPKDESEKAHKYAISMHPDTLDELEYVMQHAADPGRSAALSRIVHKEFSRIARRSG